MNDVARTLCVRAGHVLNKRDNPNNVGFRFAQRDRLHRTGDSGCAAHVALHFVHACARLQRNTAGVEGDAFADECERLALFVAGAAPNHGDETARTRAALSDAQKRAHAEPLHCLGLENIDLHAERFEIAQAFGEALRIEHVRRLAHQIAREEHAFDDGRVLFRPRFRGGGPVHRNFHRRQRRLLLGLQLGAVRVEPIGGEARAHGSVRTGFGFRDTRQSIRLQNEFLSARGQRPLHGVAGPTLNRHAISGVSLAQTDHQHAREIDAFGRQDIDHLAGAALEISGLDRLDDAPARSAIEGFACIQQVAAFSRHNRHNVAAAGGHKSNVHVVPLGEWLSRRAVPASTLVRRCGSHARSN